MRHKQHVSLNSAQEIALGVQSAPQMAAQFGGELADPALQQYVESVGQAVVQKSAAAQSPYQYKFHVLTDPKTLNAFALPGGLIFITRGDRLDRGDTPRDVPEEALPARGSAA